MEKTVVAIVANKEALTVECYYEDNTFEKFTVDLNAGLTWEEIVGPLESVIVSKH